MLCGGLFHGLDMARAILDVRITTLRRGDRPHIINSSTNQ
jgi:hypothetical protein